MFLIHLLSIHSPLVQLSCVHSFFRLFILLSIYSSNLSINVHPSIYFCILSFIYPFYCPPIYSLLHWSFPYFLQIYTEKLNALKKISEDFRRRLKEHEYRPKAVAALLQSLNLSTTFFRQVQNMTERDEIYTARDLQDIDKTNNETKVKTITIKIHTIRVIRNLE